MSRIVDIKCHSIVNSRGKWTIETQVELADGTTAVAQIPGGASTGENEALMLPVDRAGEIVTHALKDLLVGIDSYDQAKIDKEMIDLDGTPNKSHFGGNSILSISLAVAKAAAKSMKLELYDYLKYLFGNQNKDLVYPVPIFNILNGGKHAGNNLSFQEFMVIPSRKYTFRQSYEVGVQIYSDLKSILETSTLSTAVGDEGGFAPAGLNQKRALDLISAAVQKKYQLGDDVFLGCDIAAGSFREFSIYKISEENMELSSSELIDYHKDLINEYPIMYYEDPFYETDHDAWLRFTKEVSEKTLVVGDDLVVTNPRLMKSAIEKSLMNAVIVKPNQVGTLTETLEFIKMAKDNNIAICVSHRSGDNAEDTFISDLAVAVEADFIKSGAPVRGERVVKYNRILDIADGFE